MCVNFNKIRLEWKKARLYSFFWTHNTCILSTFLALNVSKLRLLFPISCLEGINVDISNIGRNIEKYFNVMQTIRHCINSCEFLNEGNGTFRFSRELWKILVPFQFNKNWVVTLFIGNDRGSGTGSDNFYKV